jgi:hypothetical protein
LLINKKVDGKMTENLNLELYAEELTNEADLNLANCLATLLTGGSFATAGSCGSSVGTSSTFSSAG